MSAFPIRYQDAALLVVDKPAGLLTIPGSDPAHPHLRGLLEATWGRLWVVHRLDRPASGLVVFARTAAAHRALNAAFAERRVHKVYQALVWGCPPWDEITLDAPLRENVGRRKRTVVDAQRGKPSVTRLRVVRRAETVTLLQAEPLTGRRHQIRAHLYHLGFPLVGDPLYGPPKPAPRLGLHAVQLTLPHPLTGTEIVVRSAFDLATLLDQAPFRRSKRYNGAR